jgi:general secretion pathway protein F
MIQVGEESGRLNQILADVASIYDEEVERSIKRLLAILEPLLIFIFGILIGGIIISILVGIMSVNQLAL